MVENINTILIIEDDAGLIELLKEIIEEAGKKTICAQTAEDAFEWLSINKPFMMILDYSLPDMNGKDFIAKLIAKKIQLPPFIVSTGQGDERIAVEMMKLGARDYIIKDNHFLEMMPVVIEKVGRVIENEKKLRLAEMALIESNQFNNQIIQSASEGIVVYDLDLKYQVWNPFMEKLIGIPASEVLGKYPADLFPFLLDAGVIDQLKKVLVGDKVSEIDLQFTIPISGKSGWASDTSAPLINASGDIVGVITTVRDITERKQAEIALQENEEKQRAMIANIADVIAIVDSDGINRYKSPNIERLFGWKPEELIGTHTLENVHPDDQEHIQKAFYDILVNPNATNNLELRYKCKDKSYKWIELTAINRIADPTIRGLLLNYHDITERKRAEVELLERESNYTGLFNTVKQAIYIQNPDLTYIAVNQGAVDMYGYEIEQLIGKTPEILSAPGKNDMNKVTEFANLAYQGKPQKYEFWGIRKDGIVFPKEVWMVKGKYFGKEVLITLATDITERKRAEEELIVSREKAEASEHKVRSMFENTLTGFLFFTASGQILEANPAAIRILGSPSLEATKQINVMTFKPLIDNGFTHEINKCLRKKIVVTNEMSYTSKWGKTVYIKYFLIPIFRQNEIIGAWANLQDLTNLWQTQTALEIAKEKAEESDQLKTAFLNNISHEIRTPLNSIIGFSKFLISDTVDSCKRENYFQIVQKGCNQLLDIVTNVIEISEIQANQTILYQKKVNLQSIFDEIYNQYNKLANDKNLELLFNINLKHNQFETISDSYKLTQIIKHLINNAIKFTFEGTIKIGCCLSEENEFVFSVSDSGIGIQKEMQQKIFEPFRQVEIGSTRNFGGNGVGLSIAKAYIELLGGKIELKSEINKGTTISFTMPFKPAETIEKIIVQHSTGFNFENKVILIAEDEFSNFLLIKEFLEPSKAKILHATNGIEAVDYCRNMSKVDIILMDIKMPKMAGNIAAKRIKEFRPGMPVIALTAYALESEKEQFADIFNDYVTKPVNEEELKQKLIKYIGVK